MSPVGIAEPISAPRRGRQPGRGGCQPDE